MWHACTLEPWLAACAAARTEKKSGLVRRAAHGCLIRQMQAGRVVCVAPPSLLLLLLPCDAHRLQDADTSRERIACAKGARASQVNVVLAEARNQNDVQAASGAFTICVQVSGRPR